MTKQILVACACIFVQAACSNHKSSPEDLAVDDLSVGDEAMPPPERDLASADGPGDVDAGPPLPAGWSFVDLDDSTAEVKAFAIHPLNHELVFVLSTTGGVFKSTDGGAHWAVANNGLVTTDFYSLAVDPTTQNKVYVGTFADGVFASTDGGATWSSVSTGLPANAVVESLVVDGSGNVWAGTYGHDGVDELPAGTTTWVAQNTGLPSTSVQQLVLDGGGTLWVGTVSGIGKFNGTTWTTFNTGLPASPSISAFAVNPLNAMDAYLTLATGPFYATSNGGTSWTLAGTGLANPSSAITIDPVTPSILYVGQVSNVYRSTDSGATFTATGSGISAGGNAVRAIAIDPTSTSTIFAGSAAFGAGVFKTTTSGTSWANANVGLTGMPTNVVAIDPATPSKMYVGTNSGVLVSENGGASFAQTALSGDQNAFAIDPFNTAILYAGTNFGIARSIDGGVTWPGPNAFPTKEIETIACDPVNSGVVYAGYDGSAQVSTDHGATWNPIVTGLPTNPYVLGLAVDPATPTTVYASVFQSGTYRSTNSGGMWTQVDTSTDGGGAILITNGIILVGTEGNPTGGNVRRSPDGTTWTSISVTSPSVNITALAADGKGAIYAGTQGRGVLRSTDAGLTWNPVNRNLIGFFVTGFATSTVGSTVSLWAATGNELFETQNGGM